MQNLTDIPLKVIHILPSNPYPPIGGAERYVLELAQAQADLGAEVKIIGFIPEAKKREFQVGLVKLTLFPYLLLLRQNHINPLTFNFLPHLRHADIIHCHQTTTMVTEMAMLVGKLLGKKVFVTSHGGGADLTISRLFNPLRFCDGIILNSKFSHLAFPNKEYIRRKVIVVPGGIATSRFTPDTSVERERKILFSGRLLPHKGVNYILEAVALLEDPTVKVVLTARTSDPKYRAYLDTQIRALHLNVEFVMPNDAELIYHYRSATVTVLPSVYTDVYGGYSPVPELLGLVLLESMACGTPVICTDVGGMPEFVVDGETGFVLPPNDPTALSQKLAFLLNNPDTARTMGEKGLRIVRERYSWSAVAAQTLALYEKTKKPAKKQQH